MHDTSCGPAVFSRLLFVNHHQQHTLLVPDLVQLLTKLKMNPTQPVIHKVLPNEMMGVIFEEHTKLEWRAPVVDGRVCRTWRQIILNTPRAWIYLEISAGDPPETTELREWLNRSGSAPLYIRVNKTTFTLDYHLYVRSLHDLLSGYHTRIVSLRLPLGEASFFERREFPSLQLLEISRWPSVAPLSCPVQWGSMPELRSLRLAFKRNSPLKLQWSELTQLEALSLYSIRLTSPPQYPQSLTTLVLDRVSVDGISSPIAFPSLTYLSLYEVTGLKPYVRNVHSRGSEVPESIANGAGADHRRTRGKRKEVRQKGRSAAQGDILTRESL
jgi:hypothetical protein